ncbi:MAG: TetR/AcrR family transcriptional regulator [Pseudomonadales bacterium]|nr:TetR/AcrR family transcriptional regulator [Pseudomonadales bacterium]
MSEPQAGNGKKTKSRSEQKHQDIVDAAELVFIELGFQKASMDKIAQVAKVSKRTVYNHFDNKNELFQTILQSCCDELYVSTDLPYQADQPLHPQLLEMLSCEWDLYTSDRFVKLARIVIGEYVTTPKFIQQFIEQTKINERGLQRWISIAIADGRLQAIDANFAYEYLNGAVKTFAHDPLLFDQPKPDEQQKDFILNEIVAMFLQRYQIHSDIHAL